MDRQRRHRNMSVGRLPNSNGSLYPCPCCGELTLFERGGDEICTVCKWHDDGQDDHDADVVRGGPNELLSLTQARELWQMQRKVF